MSTPQHASPSLTAEELAKEFAEAHEPADLKVYALEDWFTFVLFWVLCGVVFLQFFTRYVLNDSAAWTEEVARYLLIGVVFLGAAMCTRLDRHIQVDLLYRYLPRGVSRVLVTAVDVFRTSFLAYCVWLAWQVTVRVGHQPMTMMDWPLGIVFGFVGIAFAFMALRALLLTIEHLRSGSSALEAPGHLSSEG